MCVDVVDEGGHAVALGRMNGAPFVCASIALNKANGWCDTNGVSNSIVFFTSSNPLIPLRYPGGLAS